MSANYLVVIGGIEVRPRRGYTLKDIEDEVVMYEFTKEDVSAHVVAAVCFRQAMSMIAPSRLVYY